MAEAETAEEQTPVVPLVLYTVLCCYYYCLLCFEDLR